MSHAALTDCWRDAQACLWWQVYGPPPPIEMLTEQAHERIAELRRVRAHLEPPTLSGYLMSVGDGPRTIGDDITDLVRRERRWRLALACPDDRPPLFVELLELACGPRTWILHDVRRWLYRTWSLSPSSPSPLGRLIDELPYVDDRYSSTGHYYATARNEAAVQQWLMAANAVEISEARLWHRDGPIAELLGSRALEVAP